MSSTGRFILIASLAASVATYHVGSACAQSPASIPKPTLPLPQDSPAHVPQIEFAFSPQTPGSLVPDIEFAPANNVAEILCQASVPGDELRPSENAIEAQLDMSTNFDSPQNSSPSVPEDLEFELPEIEATEADKKEDQKSKDEKQKEEQKKRESEKKEKKKKEKKAKLKKAAAAAYKPLFYDNDFSYLLDSAYDGYYFGEGIKQIQFGSCCGSAGCTTSSPCTSCTASKCQAKPWMTLDIGGQYRYRYHGEQNMRGLGLTGRDDNFLLHRTRIFGSLRFGKRIRFFAEYIDALSEFETFAPRPIEENRSDMLNLFIDGTLLDWDKRKLRARVGRQEMLYGLQRLISPLDWANTRRTFDGAKVMWQGKDFDIDGFWLRPVVTNIKQFDSPNLDQQFYGIYSSYKGFEKDKLETYWLAFDNDATGFRVDSIGGRWFGEDEGWLAEMWGNYQFGTNSDGSNHSAGAWTFGAGRKSDRGWKPTLWLFYDWASGSGNAPGAGNGYFHFYPLAHKYLGFMDFFGRRNIETPNCQFSIQPTDKLKLLAWYYYFFLEDARDTPYNVTMTPFAPGVTPDSADLGHEIDMIALYKLSPRSGMLLGYSHFFSGAYYDTPGVPYRGDANFYYVQYHINF